MASKDSELLAERYVAITEKRQKKKCECPDDCECCGKKNKSLPSHSKAKNKKTFKELFKQKMDESASGFSNTYEMDKKIWEMRKQVNPEAQYFIHYKGGKTSKPLKGESVLMMLKSIVHDVESIEPVHKE